MSIFVVDILEEFLGEPRKHNDDTGQIAFDCPSCDDGAGKGNLEINYNKGVFKCWSCQDTNNMHGPVTKLIKRFGTQKNQRDYDLIKPEYTSEEPNEGEPIEVKLPEGYKKLSFCTAKDFKADMALAYLKERGITPELTPEIIKDYEIGYTYKGKFANRIIIPSYNAEGELNYFIARWFLKEYNKIKYLNPEAKKQEIIFNENKINWDSTIYLVEGVFDHIVVPNSIPLLGKFISDELLMKLHDKAKAYVVVLLDGDAYDDSIRLYKQLSFGNLTDRIRLCTPPEKFDPSMIFEKLGHKGIVMLLKRSIKISEEEL